MIQVTVKENESIERALKRFKKKQDRSGMKRELRSRNYYTKPSDKRRETVKNAQYREKKQRENAS